MLLPDGRGYHWARAATTQAFLVAVLLVAPAASAQALRDNRYTLDVFQGPVLAPSDILGMAGSYAGVAEGIDGFVTNAAAPAVRPSHSVTYLDWDASGSISIPVRLFGNDDFDNSGRVDHDYSNFYYGTLGALFQYGTFGAGINAELQRYSLTTTRGEGTRTDVFVGKYHALAAIRLLGDQLMIGGGVRLAQLSLAPHDTETALTMIGAGPEMGFLIRPDWQSFRIGATFRFPVHGGRLVGKASTIDGVATAGGLVLPDDVVLPWELEAGVAVQVGPRPLNPAWMDPHAHEAALDASFARARRDRAAEHEAELAVADPVERAAKKRVIEAQEALTRVQEDSDLRRVKKRLVDERRARSWNWPREHLLLTAELLVTGAVPNGVSLQEFLGQTQASGARVVGTSGAHVSFSPRFGVETEPIPGRMHTRVGSYYEPARLSAIGETIAPVGRQHFTFGADARLFSTTWFGLSSKVTYKLQAYADFSPRYQSVSLGLGVWR